MAAQPDMLPPHDHCTVCDAPVDVGEKYCGDVCHDKQMAQLRKEKRNYYLFIGAAAAAMIIIFIVSLVLKG
jgi:predicted nucleic acid-binding Zn ribbon protein